MRIYLDADKAIEGLAKKLASLETGAKAAVMDMLIEGSDVMIDGLQRGVAEYGHAPPGKSGRATGGLAESIQRKGSPKATEDGGEVIITFAGTDEHGERYGEIAAVLNYGSSSIPADHWIDNTVELVKPLAEQAMAQALDRHLKGAE